MNSTFHSAAAQVPNRLHDDCDHDRLDPIEDAAQLGDMTKPDIGPSQAKCGQRRGQGETDAAEQQACPTCLGVADIDGQFSRARAGNEIGHAQEVKKAFARQPLPPTNDFVFHHRNVSCWATISRGA